MSVKLATRGVYPPQPFTLHSLLRNSSWILNSTSTLHYSTLLYTTLPQLSTTLHYSTLLYNLAMKRTLILLLLVSSLVFLVQSWNSDDDDDDDDVLLTTLNTAAANCKKELCKNKSNNKLNRCMTKMKKFGWCGNLKQCLEDNVMVGGKNQCKKKQREAGVGLRKCRIGVLEKYLWCIPL